MTIIIVLCSAKVIMRMRIARQVLRTQPKVTVLPIRERPSRPSATKAAARGHVLSSKALCAQALVLVVLEVVDKVLLALRVLLGSHHVVDA